MSGLMRRGQSEESHGEPRVGAALCIKQHIHSTYNRKAHHLQAPSPTPKRVWLETGTSSVGLGLPHGPSASPDAVGHVPALL